MAQKYRADLPTIPPRLLSLPVQNGYPVPWFAAKIDEHHYDLRLADADKFRLAIKKNLCWVCGQPLGVYKAFAISPMCAINRTIAEPPSHRDCAEWSAKACPFLNQRKNERREGNYPDELQLSKPAGEMIRRQPGTVGIWITKQYTIFADPNGSGLLFRLRDPCEVLWLREGRVATREEVMHSIETGYQLLLDLAQKDGSGAVQQLEQKRQAVLYLLPKGDSDRCE
jgi:ribosomal protein S14